MFLNDSGGNSKTLTTSNFNMNIVDISTVTIISIEFSFNSRIFSIHFRYIRKFTINNYIQYITLLRLLFVFNENVNKNLLNFGTKMDASSFIFGFLSLSMNQAKHQFDLKIRNTLYLFNFGSNPVTLSSATCILEIQQRDHNLRSNN